MQKVEIELDRIANIEKFEEVQDMLMVDSNILICITSMSLEELQNVKVNSIKKLKIVKEKIGSFYNFKQNKNYDMNTLKGFGINLSVVIAVSKCDLQNRRREEYKIWIENVENFGKKYNILVIECSAKESINIKETVHLAIKNHWFRHERAKFVETVHLVKN